MSLKSNHVGPVLQSPPIACRWAGWSSDTYTLSRFGWRIAVNERYDHPCGGRVYEVILDNPEVQAKGFASQAINWPPAAMTHDYRKYEELRFDFLLARHLDVVCSDPRYTGLHIPQVDPTPMMTTLNYERMMHRTDIDKLTLFRQLPPDDRNLIIQEPTFDQILDMALKHQAPKQKELRQKRHKEGSGLLISLAA